MCKILLSINPIHVEKILLGFKKYEFRTRIAKRKVDSILIYVTSPIKKIVAEVEVRETLIDDPEKLWQLTKEYSGINKEYFNDYFKERKFAMAYKLGEVKEFEIPLNLSSYGIKAAPQSFIYI